MAEPILEHSVVILDPEGREYRAATYGEKQEDGTWWGWIEFQPRDGGPALVTGRETTQPNLQALGYWASGLEPIYFEGALTRAMELAR
jgi:hypothetical protein